MGKDEEEKDEGEQKAGAINNEDFTSSYEAALHTISWNQKACLGWVVGGKKGMELC